MACHAQKSHFTKLLDLVLYENYPFDVGFCSEFGVLSFHDSSQSHISELTDWSSSSAGGSRQYFD